MLYIVGTEALACGGLTDCDTGTRPLYLSILYNVHSSLESYESSMPPSIILSSHMTGVSCWPDLRSISALSAS